ncbi:hypothetical protein Q5H91_15550, partial [Sphingomonas sp. KR1UV-12]
APSFEKTRDLVFGDRCKNHPVHRCGERAYMGRSFARQMLFCVFVAVRVIIRVGQEPGGVAGASPDRRGAPAAARDIPGA